MAAQIPKALRHLIKVIKNSPQIKKERAKNGEND